MLKKIDRYVLKECTWTTLSVVAVLLLILLGNTVVRVLGDIAKGKLPPEALWPMLAVNLVHYLVVLIPIGVYLGILLGMGRFYRDSEAAAMFACGIGIQRLYRAILALALPAVLLTVVLSFFLAPWTAGKQETLLHQARHNNRLGALAAGRFNVADNGRQTLFFERRQDNGDMEAVFLHSDEENGRSTVQTARRAEAQQHGSSTYIVFEHGRAYSGSPGALDYRVTEFEAHGVRIEREPAPLSLRTSAASTSSLLVSDKAEHRAEWHWRLAVPVACLLLALLALPLSHSAPRKGRFGKVGVGILIYIIYFNLLGVGRAWLERSTVPGGLGLWWAHGLMLAVVVLLVMKQERAGPFARRTTAP